jgi:hypothetical protein
LGADITDVLAYHRKAQEELEERLAKRMEQQQQQAARPAPAPVQEARMQRNDEMDDIKRMMAQLAGSVQSLADRMEDRERDRDRDARFETPPPPPAPAVPQLDLLAVIKEVAAMTNKPAPVVPAGPPPMGMAEMFAMMAQAKQVFAPAQVNIDVSPLEERIEDLQRDLAESKKKGGISALVDEVKSIKEVMGVLGMGGEKKESGGLGGALGSLVDKIVNDPEPIAMAVERILGATAQLKAANTGRPVQQRPQQPPRDPLPPQLRKATETLLRAQGDAAIVAAGYEFVTALGTVEQTKKLADKLTNLLRLEKTNELTIYLRQILTHFGYGDAVGIERIQTIATTLIAQVKRVNAAAAEEEEEDSEEESDEQPDLTVRVGGTGDEADESGDEYEEDDSGEQDDSEVESDDTEVTSEEPDASFVQDDEPVEEAPEQEEKPRRKRRTKAEMAAARAAEEETQDDAPVAG